MDQFQIVVGDIGGVLPPVGQHAPGLSIKGGLQLVALGVSGSTVLTRDSLLGEVHLDSAQLLRSPEIDLKPLARILSCGGPPGADVLVDGIDGGMTRKFGGCSDWLAMAQEHPSRRILRFGVLMGTWQELGVIPQRRGSEHPPFLVKSLRIDGDPPFKAVIDPDKRGDDPPEVARGVGEGRAVACAW